MAEEMLSREIFSPDHYVFYQKDGGYHDFIAVEEYLYNAIPVIFDKISGANESDNAVSMEKEIIQTEITEYYTKNTLISEVQSDPAFGNYGRMIFLVDSGYMGGSNLGNLSLAWYNYIDPDKTVEICNYMKSQAENGNTFFMIYIQMKKRRLIRKMEIPDYSFLKGARPPGEVGLAQTEAERRLPGRSISSTLFRNTTQSIRCRCQRLLLMYADIHSAAVWRLPE